MSRAEATAILKRGSQKVRTTYNGRPAVSVFFPIGDESSAISVADSDCDLMREMTFIFRTRHLPSARHKAPAAAPPLKS